MIAYLNINSLREKIVILTEVLIKTKLDELCVDETKLDASFPDHQFKTEDYQFPPLRIDQNSKGEGKMVFIREGFNVKQMKTFETANAETICLEFINAKKKWCILFAYRPPSTNKDKFFEEIFASLNKMLGNYDNIALAGDLNIDELNSCSDLSNHLSDMRDVFNLSNLIKEPNLI